MMRAEGELYRMRVVYCEPEPLISTVAFYKHAMLFKKLLPRKARDNWKQLSGLSGTQAQPLRQPILRQISR
jgi:hypothetical protein